MRVVRAVGCMFSGNEWREEGGEEGREEGRGKMY